MPLTIAVVDDTDGTGATATIAGSSGAVVSVLAGQVSGLVGTIPFAVVATRTGDGTVALPLTTAGMYFAYASVTGATSPLYYFPVSNYALAVATRCRRAVVATIKLLAIPPAANVYEQMFPDESNVMFPNVICTVDGVQETSDVILNNRSDVGRPVKVMISDRADKWDHSMLPSYELWRQSIVRCFIDQQLAGVPESKICKIEPYVIVDPNARQYQHMVSGLVVRCICREVRGVGT